MKTKVFPFIERVKSCLNCKRFGHTALQCRGSPRCNQCARSHIEKDCTNDVHCGNCGSNLKKLVFRQNILNESDVDRIYRSEEEHTTLFNWIVRKYGNAWLRKTSDAHYLQDPVEPAEPENYGSSQVPRSNSLSPSSSRVTIMDISSQQIDEEVLLSTTEQPPVQAPVLQLESTNESDDSSISHLQTSQFDRKKIQDLKVLKRSSASSGRTHPYVSKSSYFPDSQQDPNAKLSSRSALVQSQAETPSFLSPVSNTLSNS